MLAYPLYFLLNYNIHIQDFLYQPASAPAPAPASTPTPTPAPAPAPSYLKLFGRFMIPLQY